MSSVACVTSDIPGSDLSVELRALVGAVGGVVDGMVELFEYVVSEVSTVE